MCVIYLVHELFLHIQFPILGDPTLLFLAHLLIYLRGREVSLVSVCLSVTKGCGRCDVMPCVHRFGFTVQVMPARSLASFPGFPSK